MNLGRLARRTAAFAIPIAGLAALATRTDPTFASQAPARAHGDWGVAYAPIDTGSPRPAIVFLHGMWASPEDSCEPFASAATPFGFLVCPRGNARLKVPVDAGALGTTWVDDDSDAGLKMWSGSSADAARAIHAALEASDALAPGKRTRRGGTLIGFSNGAYFAAEVACAEPGRWTGLVLLSMKLDLDPARLRQAGVTRVVLAAGERDDVQISMKALAARLHDASAGGGADAKYVSLGDVGHAFPSDMGVRMCDAIAWVRGSPAYGGESPCKAHR